MPPLTGFSDNPFESREDVLRGAVSFLNSLQPYKSPCCARIKLSTSTGTGFDEISAQLEGFARPLWVVADLLAQNDPRFSHLDLSSWILGLEAGTDPREELYWGDVGDHDQRMVEMEPIAYALLTAPSVFLPKSQQKRDMIMKWLRAINERKVPPSNWRWFRILVNLALVKSFGVPYSEVKPLLDTDFEILDSFYLSDGWSSDGMWCDDKKQADYYSGSFAIQYSQLAFVRFASDLDPERAERYRSEAGKFAETFWRYFDANGAAIPFGRSLSYRFTFAAFWSAVVVADVSLPAPLNALGIVKGILMRHLRWWTRKSDIFNTDGTLVIGYTYPNMYMSEDYNSPQSLYWCLKTFSVLGLAKDHPFWTCEELPHPLSSTRKPLRQDLRRPNALDTPQLHLPTPDTIAVVNPAVQITCGTREHHFLLSAGQFTRKTHRAREAKYGKFAYSSAFAFSVPAGTLLSQMAPDSTLSISNDDGETWRVRWEPIAARISSVKLSIKTPGEQKSETAISPALVSGWRPWKPFDLQIETVLVPPLEQWPGWHIRIHKLTWKTRQMNATVDLVDAGFAISSQGVKGGVLPHLDEELRHHDASKREHGCGVAQEGVWEGAAACLILSDAGASGVTDLSGNNQEVSLTNVEGAKHSRRGYILQPDANTNLVAQRTLIPTIYHNFDVSDQDSGDVGFVIGIFAVAASAGLDPVRIREMWQNKPNITLHEYLEMPS